MPTTIDQNRAALAALQTAHTQTIAMQQPGKIVFAGNLWPDPAGGIGLQIKSEVTEALTEARALVESGLRKVKAARRGDQESVALMSKWFGPPTVAGPDDWWQGVDYILTAMDQALLRDIKVFYRGADVLGRLNDYPAGTPGSGTPLTGPDVSGYAETFFAKDLNIGLCRVFFERDPYKARTIRRKGFDSIGGVLVHELSHNLCDTDDHKDANGRFYYGTNACQKMITTHNLAREAWYNADNIEYFCEEAYYGIIVSPPPVTRLAVPALAAAHQQAQADAAETHPSTAPATPGADVRGLAQDHEQAQRDAAQTQTSKPVETGVDVKALRDKFK